MKKGWKAMVCLFLILGSTLLVPQLSGSCQPAVSGEAPC
jgi:hypothetical protein